MAKKAKPEKAARSADVETYKYKEAKQKSVPTAENQTLIADDEKAVKSRSGRAILISTRNLAGAADMLRPIRRRCAAGLHPGKITPRAIIDDLRRQTKYCVEDAAPKFDFLQDFSGLPKSWKEDATQSYYDEGDWSNRMIPRNSLLVVASLAKHGGLRVGLEFVGGGC